MLDLLGKLARRAAPLKSWALLASVSLALATAAALVFDRDERYLILGIVGLLWSLSVYAFVSTFRFVPRRSPPEAGALERLGTRLRRAWLWLLALGCAGATLAAMVTSVRLLLLWWREYGA